jgi:hypothetical protein
VVDRLLDGVKLRLQLQDASILDRDLLCQLTYITLHVKNAILEFLDQVFRVLEPRSVDKASHNPLEGVEDLAEHCLRTATKRGALKGASYIPESNHSSSQ